MKRNSRSSFVRHITVRPNLLAGAMLQLDYAEADEGTASTEGYGRLIGPDFI